MYPRVHALTYPLPQASFPVHCLYGTGLDTDMGYVYDIERFSKDVPPAPKTVRKGPGDGTVNAHSLEACSRCAHAAPSCLPHAQGTLQRPGSSVAIL